MDDCDVVLGMLAEHELLLHAEDSLRNEPGMEEAEREMLVLRCKNRQIKLTREIASHKRNCIVYNPNIFKEP